MLSSQHIDKKDLISDTMRILSTFERQSNIYPDTSKTPAVS